MRSVLVAVALAAGSVSSIAVAQATEATAPRYEGWGLLGELAGYRWKIVAPDRTIMVKYEWETVGEVLKLSTDKAHAYLRREPDGRITSSLTNVDGKVHYQAAADGFERAYTTREGADYRITTRQVGPHEFAETWNITRDGKTTKAEFKYLRDRPLLDRKVWGLLADLDGKGWHPSNFTIQSPDGTYLVEARRTDAGLALSAVYGIGSDGFIYKTGSTLEVSMYRGRPESDGSIAWSRITSFPTVAPHWSMAGSKLVDRTVSEKTGDQYNYRELDYVFVDPTSEEIAKAMELAKPVAENMFAVASTALAQIGRQNAVYAAKAAADDRMIARNAAMAGVANTIRSVGSAVGEVTSAAAAISQQKLATTLAAQAAVKEADERRQMREAAERAEVRHAVPATSASASSMAAASGTSASAGTTPAPSATPKPAPATVSLGAQGAGAALRFVLWIPLRDPVTGPRGPVNASCYSNIISVPGPAGWPAPKDGVGPARQIVEGYFGQLQQACAAYGPFAGPPQYEWNRTGSDPDTVFNAYERDQGGQKRVTIR